MTLNSKTVRVSDEISAVETDIETVKSEASEVDDKESDEWDELQEMYEQMARRKKKLEEAVEEMGGGEFTLQQISFGTKKMIEDEVLSASYTTNVNTGSVEGVPRTGLYQIKWLERSITSYPEGQEADPKELPDVIGEWLFEEAQDFNSTEDSDAMDFSLESAMEE